MGKPAFDPNKPFEAAPATASAKPAFDPNKPLDSEVEKPGFWDFSDAPKPAESFSDIPRTVVDTVKYGTGKQWGALARAADWLGGMSRTGIAGAAGVADSDDALKALQGEAPTTGQYLEKGGVPEGPKDPLLNKISARDAAGFIGDIATDPLTYLTGGASLATGDAVRDLGQSTYRSGLKRIDQEVAKYGKEPVSKVLEKEGVWGSERSIAKQMDQLAADRLARRNAILQEATDAGARVDRGSMMAPANDYLKNLVTINNPEQGALRETTADRIASYLDQPGNMPTPMQTSSWKTTAANRVGDKNWEILRTTPEGKKLDKAISRGLKEATEESVGKTLGKEKAFELSTQNDELGRLLTSQEKAAHVADIAERKNHMTQVDAMLAGLGQLPALVFKKTAGTLQGAGARTGGGLALQKLGETQFADALAKRAYLASPWAQMEEKKK